MSKTIPVPVTPAPPQSPYVNPSYPRRIHFGEQAAYLELLQSFDARIAEFRRKLDALGGGADRPKYEKLFLQLQGARDQTADTIRRMPLEAAELYREDRERFQAAIEAFERIAKCWSA